MTEDVTDEVISAALDGEVVDMAALRSVLETPHGQKTLAAFVLLRATVAADRSAIEADRPAPVRQGSTGVGVRRRSLRLSLAASLGACALAGSFWLGTTWAPARPTAPAAATVVPPNAAGPPPTPVRRLEYVPGVDWDTGS